MRYSEAFRGIRYLNKNLISGHLSHSGKNRNLFLSTASVMVVIFAENQIWVRSYGYINRRDNNIQIFVKISLLFIKIHNVELNQQLNNNNNSNPKRMIHFVSLFAPVHQDPQCKHSLRVL